MKNEFYLCRNGYADGLYNLYFVNLKDIPEYDNCSETWDTFNDKTIFIICLCPKLTKKWLGLEKHLRRGTMIKIELDIKCKVIK